MGRKDITDAELDVEGFSIYRADRRDRKGGGVSLYIRSSFSVEVRKISTSSDSRKCYGVR